MIDLHSWLWLVLIASVAAVLRGLTGFGAALIMAPALSIVVGARDAIALSMALNTLMLVQLFIPAAKIALWRIVVPMAIGTVLAYQIGLHVFLAIDPVVAKRVIGIAGVVFALLALVRWRWHRQSTASAVAIGAVTGMSLGVSGVGGPLAPLYIISGDGSAVLKRACMIAYTGIMQASAVPPLIVYKVLTPQLFVFALTALPFALVMTHVGTKLFERTNEASFRRLAIGLTVILGITAAIL
ncbi:MAG: TSUP family transporter [Vulcanimicrobiaceae bacterium]